MGLEQVLENINADLAALRERNPEQRARSRYVGPNADRAAVEHVANGGSADDYKAGGFRLAPPGDAASDGLAVLRDVKAAARGDAGAWQRLARSAKAITGGELLVPDTLLPDYIELRTAAAPVRALAREFDVDGREVHFLLESGQLAPDWTPEAGTKPASSAAVSEKVALVYKPSGVATVPDSLLEDSRGLAETIVTRSFARAIGRKIDQALLDGDGIGKPLGVLRVPGVNAVAVADQTAVALYDAIQGAIARLRAKFIEPSAVVMRPEHALRFRTARASGTGEYLWATGPDFGVPVVYDSNLPTAGTPAAASVIVGDWKTLYSRAAQCRSCVAAWVPPYTWTPDTISYACGSLTAAPMRSKARNVVSSDTNAGCGLASIVSARREKRRSSRTRTRAASPTLTVPSARRKPPPWRRSASRAT